MLYILYFTERGNVKMMWGWLSGLGIYTDCISYCPDGKFKKECGFTIKIQ